MINYTLTPDNRQNDLVNKKIQKDIDYICTHVKRILGKNLYALLLCGGFGRGEGSVTLQEETVHIVNDYDFTVVLNAKTRLHYLRLYKKFHPPLETLAHELAAHLDIKQVDLSPKPLFYFRNTDLRIENYEVKNGNVFVYGKDNPTRLMPQWQAKDIPLYEGTWLFRNRGLGLILAAFYFIASPKVADDKKENFITECNKANLAAGDSVLLLKKEYHHLYNERLNRAREIDFTDIPMGEVIKENYINALRQKLHPDFSRYTQIDFKDWWYDTKQIFINFFHYYEEKRLNQQFETWEKYADLFTPENRINLKTAAGKLIRSTGDGVSFDLFRTTLKKSSPTYSIRMVALLLASIHKNGFDTGTIKKAASLLGVTPNGPSKSDWLFLSRLLLAEIHPGGEVGQTLAALTGSDAGP